MVALFVLATIVLFLAVDGIVILARRRRTSALAPATALAARIAGPHRMPSGMFLHPSHLWLTIDPQGRVRVGLDELAQRLLGPIQGVRFQTAGQRIARGDTLFSIQVGDAEIPMTSPVSGVLEKTQIPAHGRTGTDPESWLCSLQPEKLGEEIRPLRLAEEAASWLTGEFARLRETLHGLRLSPAMATLPDGGEPVDGLLLFLDGPGRDTVVRSFFVREV
jgi:glycine cleavage system H lipoate-binding protein